MPRCILKSADRERITEPLIIRIIIRTRLGASEICKKKTLQEFARFLYHKEKKAVVRLGE